MADENKNPRISYNPIVAQCVDCDATSEDAGIDGWLVAGRIPAAYWVGTLPGQKWGCNHFAYCPKCKKQAKIRGCEKNSKDGKIMKKKVKYWLAASGSNQIEFADGTVAIPSPLDSYAHTHGSVAYQEANEEWHRRFSRATKF